LDGGATFEIEFDDGQATKCKAVASSEGELVCLTEPFDKEISEGGSHTMTVVING
jgi:hypothetical protein